MSGSKGSGFFKGFLTGGLIVIIISFLLSQKGKDTIREAIREGKEAAARKEAEVTDEMEKEDLI